MFNFSNIFLRKNKRAEDRIVRPNENAIIVAVDEEGRTMLRLSVQNIQSKKSSEYLAKALFALQSGVFQQEIEDLIVEFANQTNDVTRNFMEETLAFYTIYFDIVTKNDYNNLNNEKPVISPLKFSSIVQNGEK